MQQYKVGDLVISNKTCSGARANKVYRVFYTRHTTTPSIGETYESENSACQCSENWRFATEAEIKAEGIKITPENMTLKDKFALAFKGEPEKSFIKAGIMNADESLTTEGREVWTAWLVRKFGADFKTEVVDPILAEDEKAK